MKKKWLIPFLNYVILGFLTTGFHQIFEFLTLVTDNQIIYKIGLSFSMCTMFFFIRSLEILFNRNLKSKIALIVIAMVILHIFFSEMYFESFSFYLQHKSTFIWSMSWMFLFFYFHICAIKGHRLLKNDQTKKTILIYLLALVIVTLTASTLTFFDCLTLKYVFP